MSRYELVTLTNTDPEFYRVIGPFLARREVHAALGGVPWDEDGKTWIAALAKGQSAGVAGVRTSRGLAHIESLYVTDGHEDARAVLLAAAMAAAAPSPMHAMVRREHAGAHLAAGFKVVKESTNFLTLAKGDR